MRKDECENCGADCVLDDVVDGLCWRCRIQKRIQQEENALINHDDEIKEDRRLFR